MFYCIICNQLLLAFHWTIIIIIWNFLTYYHARYLQSIYVLLLIWKLETMQQSILSNTHIYVGLFVYAKVDFRDNDMLKILFLARIFGSLFYSPFYRKSTLQFIKCCRGKVSLHNFSLWKMQNATNERKWI